MNDKVGTNKMCRVISVLHGLLALEGTLAVFALFHQQSMQKNAFLFGYSYSRLLLGLFSAVIVLFSFIQIILLWRYTAYTKKFGNFLENNVLAGIGKRPVISVYLLLLSLAMITALMILRKEAMSGSTSTAAAIVDRGFWVFTWLASIPAQVFATLYVLFREEIKRVYSLEFFWKYGILIMMLVLTGFYWFTLLFQLDWLGEIRGWFFKFVEIKEASPDQIILLIVLPIILFVAFLLMNRSSTTWKYVAAVIALGAVLQVSFGIAMGEGIESLRKKYANTHLSEELRVSCKYTGGVVEGLRDFGPLTQHSQFYRTKPPGLFGFYNVVREFAGLFQANVNKDPQFCFNTVTSLFAYTLPIITYSTLFFVFRIEKSLKTGEDIFPTVLLYITAPNVLLMVFVPDQFLYPIFFASCVFMTVIMVTNRSRFAGFVGGVLLYTGTFISFSLLPLFGIIPMFFLLTAIIDKKLIFNVGFIKVLLLFILGFFLMWVLAEIVLDYNMIERYLVALSDHRYQKGFSFSLVNLINYVKLNNVEYSFWVGIPLYLLALVGGVRSLFNILTRKGSRYDAFSASVLVTFIALNLLGQTKGEVGRIWIFFLSVGVIPAAHEAMTMFEKRKWGVLLVMTLQLISASLMFYFMDWK